MSKQIIDKRNFWDKLTDRTIAGCRMIMNPYNFFYRRDPERVHRARQIRNYVAHEIFGYAEYNSHPLRRVVTPVMTGVFMLLTAVYGYHAIKIATGKVPKGRN